MISNLNGRIILDYGIDPTVATILSLIREGYMGNELIAKIYELFPDNQ